MPFLFIAVLSSWSYQVLWSQQAVCCSHCWSLLCLSSPSLLAPVWYHFFWGGVHCLITFLGSILHRAISSHLNRCRRNEKTSNIMLTTMDARQLRIYKGLLSCPVANG
jgi:hypothetical protein